MEFLTHLSTLRRCRCLNLDTAGERRALNCGVTEIRRNCLEPCPCNGTAETTAEAVGGVEPGAGSGIATPDDIADGAAAASKPPTAPGGPCRDRDREF